MSACHNGGGLKVLCLNRCSWACAEMRADECRQLQQLQQQLDRLSSFCHGAAASAAQAADEAAQLQEQVR